MRTHPPSSVTLKGSRLHNPRIHHLTRELDFAPKTEKDIHKVGASSK